MVKVVVVNGAPSAGKSLFERLCMEKCSYLSDAEAFCTPVTAFYAGEEKEGAWIPYREPEPEPEPETETE